MKRTPRPHTLGIFFLAAIGSLNALGCGASSPSRAPRSVPPAIVTAQAPGPGAEPLAWLAGSWRCVTDAGLWEEHWYPPIQGTIAGSLRWTRPDGTLALLELFSIEPAALEPGRAAEPVLFLRHFSAGLEPWAREREAAPRYTIEHADDRRLVALSFPDQLTKLRYLFDPASPDALTAEVLKRAGIDDDWSALVFLAFERGGRR